MRQHAWQTTSPWGQRGMLFIDRGVILSLSGFTVGDLYIESPASHSCRSAAFPLDCTEKLQSALIGLAVIVFPAHFADAAIPDSGIFYRVEAAASFECCVARISATYHR